MCFVVQSRTQNLRVNENNRVKHVKLATEDKFIIITVNRQGCRMTDVACAISRDASVFSRVSRSNRLYADDAHAFIDFRYDDIRIVKINGFTVESPYYLDRGVTFDYRTSC